MRGARADEKGTHQHFIETLYIKESRDVNTTWIFITKNSKEVFAATTKRKSTNFSINVVKDYEKLYRDNIEAKETLERVSSKLEHYQHMENTLHNTLVIAQETAEEVKLNAKKETELVMKEAEIRAQKLVEDAISKGRRITVNMRN